MKQWKFWCLTLTLLLGFTFSMDAVPVRVIPINEGEAVFAVFWDPVLHEVRQNWKLHAGSSGSQSWCNYGFRWDKRKVKRNQVGFGMSMTEKFTIGNYDLAIFSCAVPPGAKLKVSLETDQGPRVKEWIAVSGYRDEYKMPLEGATQIQKVTFEVYETGKNKITKGFLLWMGFENTVKLKNYLARLKFIASQPLNKFLASPSVKPDFKGRTNLLAPPKTLAKLQQEYAAQKKKTGKDPMKMDVSGYKVEENLSDIIPFANPTLFGRVRDQERKYKYISIETLINKGLVCKDEAMLRAAVRTALIYALSPQWDCTFYSYFMDSSWDQRVFCQSGVAYQVALVLDYCHELLSPAGEMLLAKKLALEGLGQINYNVWRYAYLFGNNQLSVFTAGRLASYLVLEDLRAWHGKVIVPYTELALKEMLESVKVLIHPDGSFLEGPPYFGYTLSGIQPVLEMYANARGKDIRKVIPSNMKNLGAFGDAFISTDRRGGVIPISSGQGNGRGTSPTVNQFLARIAPDSQWVNLYNSLYRAKGDAMFYNLSLRIYHNDVPRKMNPLKELVQLPIMGVAASQRYYRGKITKILVNGTKAKVQCHRHNDRGSFVLEFAGDTFAADPGGQNYSDVDGDLVKRSDYHNMLVPSVMPNNEPMNVAPKNVYPVVKGNKKSFSSRMDATAGSHLYFKSWVRNIESPTPDQYIFTDKYTLKPGFKAARFLWVTELPVQILKNNTVRIDGKEAYCLITVPKGMKIRQETMIVRKKEKYTRLSFEKPGRAGTIRIQARFYLKDAAKGTKAKPELKAAKKTQTVKSTAAKKTK